MTNLKAAFFDKETRTFSETEQLTFTTNQDYTADVLAHAAYDPDTDRLILYYTKTEYDEIGSVNELGEAFSVMAYLFYKDGAWQNNGSVYADDELDGTEAERADYRQQWYGQRFLDLRPTEEGALLRVVDSDAIYYNGLGLFAWTMDRGQRGNFILIFILLFIKERTVYEEIRFQGKKRDAGRLSGTVK